MELAFTTAKPGRISQDVVCVVQHEAAPRKQDLVEIADIIYLVENVEWHVNRKGVDDDGNIIGVISDVIVRLKKIGEA